MDKNNYIYWALGIAGIIILVSFISGPNNNQPQSSPTPSLSVSPTPLVSKTPISQVTPKATVKPRNTPSIMITEDIPYKQLVEILYKENRWLLLAEDCSSITPSGVDYYNNTQIMIDNNLSSKSRIIKIGNTEYSLDAHQYIFATLSSQDLPAHLPIYCGGIELGAIDLIK